MLEQEIPVRTADGQMTTYAVHPDGDAPYPVAVVFMDGAGHWPRAVLAASAAFERVRPWTDAYPICEERPLS